MKTKLKHELDKITHGITAGGVSDGPMDSLQWVQANGTVPHLRDCSTHNTKQANRDLGEYPRVIVLQHEARIGRPQTLVEI